MNRNKSKLMKKIFLLGLLQLSAMGAIAQDSIPANRLFIGVAGGVRVNFMRYSDLSKALFPDRDATTGGVFSVFVDYEFGSNLQFALRPEFDFARRGGRLSNIQSPLLGEGVTDQVYQVNANYLDIRVPFMYNFLGATSRVRPYVLGATIFSFPMSGNIQLRGRGADGSDQKYKVGLNNSNISQFNFALAVGAGVKCYFPIAGHDGYVGLEAIYEQGLSNTYSGDEKKHHSQVNGNLFPKNYVVNGSRKFSGLEFRLTIGMPISIFDRKKNEASPKPVIVEEPIEKPQATETFESRCCTLDDIIGMMARGEAVEGKTICAIDDINFDFNKSEIREESFGYLDKLAATLVRMNAQVEVKGHTDNIGTDEVNMRISRQRAKAVMDYLVAKGVKANKISYSYYGATFPLTSNDTLEGRRLNRRVEIEILE